MSNPAPSTPRPRRTRAAKARKTPNRTNEPASRPTTPLTTNDSVAAITRNWNIVNVNACIAKSLWPKQHGDASQWGDDVIELLRQASLVPGTSNRDFRAKMRTAIQARQARNTSKKGKVGYMTATDIRAVLRMYSQEHGTSETAANQPPSQSQSRPQSQLKDSRPKPSTEAKPIPINIPLTPANPPTPSTAATSAAVDASENAPRAPISGKHIWGVRIPVTRVDFQAGTSPTASSSPARPRRTRNRTRNKNKAEETAVPPVQVHVDPDPRNIDDTGFVSELDEGDGEDERVKPARKRKRKPRLSRLQRERVTVPTWTRDVEDVVEREGEMSEMREIEEGMEKVVL
jgi:hypothetical protein